MVAFKVCVLLYFFLERYKEFYYPFCFLGSPNPPLNIVAKEVTSRSALLEWKPPSILGSNPNGIYVIKCINCPSDRKEFPLNTTNSSIVCTGLVAYATYKITITKQNNITELTDKRFSSIEYFFRTLPGGKYKVFDS